MKHPLNVRVLALFGVLLVACSGELANLEGPGPTPVNAQLALTVANALALNVGDSKLLSVTVSSTGGEAYSLDFTSSNARVASVTAQGVVTAVAGGTATVTIQATLLGSGKTASAAIAVTVGGAGSVTLAVAGAPKLPLNGTTTAVTVGFVNQTPSKVELSRDGYPAFATWPNDTFFTLAADQRSLTGHWCISSSCWLDVSGAHVLNVLATYADGSTASASVQLDVQDTTGGTGGGTGSTGGGGGTTLPSGVEFGVVTSTMWSEINTQRAAFGDTNDCQARVNALPTSGGVTLKPGDDINAALASNSVVFLSGGTYKPSRRVTVLEGHKLIGVAGQTVTIDASNDTYGVLVQSNAVLANVIVDGSLGDGVTLYNAPTDTGAAGALVYRVSSRRSGYSNPTSDGSSGIRLTQSASYNCIVSAEAFDTWNELGAPNDHGGNSDGVDNSFGAHHNTFIDVHAYRNGDDGFDMWAGGVTFWYFSVAHDNGKTTGKTLTGDGNGVKLGIGSVSHQLYKVSALNNKSHGFNLNGNTLQPKLVQCDASGNGEADYGNGVTQQ